MTRTRMYTAIKKSLAEEGLELEPECKDAVDIAVRASLNYLLEYSQIVSNELISSGLYSEAMVAGVFVAKIKGLMNGNNE